MPTGRELEACEASNLTERPLFPAPSGPASLFNRDHILALDQPNLFNRQRSLANRTERSEVSGPISVNPRLDTDGMHAYRHIDRHVAERSGGHGAENELDPLRLRQIRREGLNSLRIGDGSGFHFLTVKQDSNLHSGLSVGSAAAEDFSQSV